MEFRGPMLKIKKTYAFKRLYVYNIAAHSNERKMACTRLTYGETSDALEIEANSVNMCRICSAETQTLISVEPALRGFELTQQGAVKRKDNMANPFVS
ncbi:hypothetical protein XELAEV_18014978mg [Xenopus laevis]|uniref:Uncharacterized protein n=1 Tax=Xenopus laevis TaxID=8355 RepID=A0A974HVY4_XENLA|nr:hypothetical protein XELAEV_18014978mg [Xenopus laevis]